MFEKIKEFVLKLNERGIIIPLLYDNVKKRGSYTLTMFWISFNLAILMLVGKVTKFLGDVDYSNVLWLLGITGSFYLGRSYKKDGSSMELGSQPKDETEPPV